MIACVPLGPVTLPPLLPPPLPAAQENAARPLAPGRVELEAKNEDEPADAVVMDDEPG